MARASWWAERAASPISRALAGKRVAVPYWYSMHNVVLQFALRESGVTPVIRGEAGPGECALQILPPPEMPAALAAGKIDGLHRPPSLQRARRDQGRRADAALHRRYLEKSSCCVVVAHERQVAGNPDWTGKAVDAIVRAQAYCAKNREEVARLISKDVAATCRCGRRGVKAMTDYGAAYESSGAIRHPEWSASRIDFQPGPTRPPRSSSSRRWAGPWSRATRPS